jgi:hypothetical protein
MRRCWVIGLSFHRPQRSLTSDAAPELLLHFLTATLFDRIRASAQGQQCDSERNQKGPHLLILWSADFIARRLRVDTLERETVILSGAQRSRRIPRGYRN